MDELQWAVSALDRAGAASLHRLAEPGGENGRGSGGIFLRMRSYIER